MASYGPAWPVWSVPKSESETNIERERERERELEREREREKEETKKSVPNITWHKEMFRKGQRTDTKCARSAHVCLVYIYIYQKGLV